MGKMMNALLLVFALEIAFALFPASGFETTSLTEFLKNPGLWNITSFFNSISGLVVGIGIGAIIIGSLWSGNDWIWRAAIIAVFITFGAVLAQLSQFLFAHLTFIGVIEARSLIVAAVVGPLLLYFIMASLDFISGKD